MKIEERDERIRSVFTDIVNGEIDLRPDFQRGEVWTGARKKLLVDTILRGWHMPPVHLVHIGSAVAEVLDGQQRLTAIRDFMQNKFSIDGKIEPVDEEISQLDGKRFKDLSSEERALFERYRIKVYEITEYNHGEPGELFHRLNQSVKLTSAEQRNAFFGAVRQQISLLVKLMAEVGVDKEILGFSNSRMAYNDLLTRVCFQLESKGLRQVVTDKSLNTRFRSEVGFDDKIISSLKVVINFLAEVRSLFDVSELSLTKASSFSWIYLLASQVLNGRHLDESYLLAFKNLELSRSAIKKNRVMVVDVLMFFELPESKFREFVMLYIERSSSRVMSVGSILIRDIVLSYCCYKSGVTEGICFDKCVELDALLKESDQQPKILIESMSENWRSYCDEGC